MRTDLLWRAVAPVAAVLVLVLGGPSPLAGCLALGGLATVVDRLVALRGLGLADRVLVDVGAMLVTLVLTGLTLGSAGIGLRPASWVVAAAADAGAGLVVAALLTARTDRVGTRVAPGGRRALRALPWTALAVVVVIVSVHLSATSLARTDTPPLEMYLGPATGDGIEIQVSAGEDLGPLRVRTRTEGRTVTYPAFILLVGQTVTTAVSLPSTGRYVITLVSPNQTRPLRKLVLDR